MMYTDAPRGEPSAYLPPDAFVAFAQNHDQIGNRAFGERIDSLAPPEAVRAVGAVYLLLPQVPMLFMGEEWGAREPFPFFCDFHGELGEAVRKGRREEFARFPEFQDEATRARIPDPQAEATFQSAKLQWRMLEQEPSASHLAWRTDILACRRRWITPLAAQTGGNAATFDVIGEGAVAVRWTAEDGTVLALAVNLSSRAVDGFPPAQRYIVWAEGDAGSNGRLEPWSVRWSITPPWG